LKLQSTTIEASMLTITPPMQLRVWYYSKLLLINKCVNKTKWW
jgi:hypothetical protein